MAIHNSLPGSSTRGQQNSVMVDVMPAPTKGIDARAPTGNMPPDVCVYTYNLMPAEYGMLLRPGYREWCIGLGGTGVHSIVAFTGVDPGAVDDRLFAMTNEAIWDVTTSDAPVERLSFGVTSAGAGHGVSAHYIDQGGSDFLYYADAQNGLHIYDGDSGAWAVAAGITGPILGSVVFVMTHKQRMWLVEEGKSSAWYLPVASGLGEATEFYFGAKFPHGGRVYAMYNWSVDGGQGIDDLLVVVSSSGDVVVYQGDDPTSTEGWTIRGTYYIGDIPIGRKIGSEYSGDLYLLSSFGLISMSDLIRGVDTQNPGDSSLAFRVARPLREQIKQKKTEFGWEPTFIPPLGQMLVLIPQVLSEEWIQYNLTLATEGWGFWRGVPATCITDWQGVAYFGTRDGRICAMDTTRDNVLLTPPPEPELNGEPVPFSLLSSYQNMRSPGLFKRVLQVRPNYYSNATPVYEQRVLYDYTFEEPPPPVAGEEVQGEVWDGGLWDLAVWSSQSGSSTSPLGGTTGVGRSVSIALRGESGEELRLISWDIMWNVGGPI
ncbi:hypothetical protein N9937_01340 [bacterium]|nr:hypothetical protein [bacterium]